MTGGQLVALCDAVALLLLIIGVALVVKSGRLR